MRRGMFAILVLLLALPGTARAADKFFLHDGDTVVFYGDSITEQQMYGRDIENYVVTRFPKWHVRFINSGWGGDRVTGGGGGDIDLRLERDVFNYKPTVVTIFLGMNDGGYRAYDEELFQTYSKGLTYIVGELQQKLPKVRLTLLTPSMFDNKDGKAPGSAEYNQTLIKYGDFVKKLGAERGIPVVDLNAPMVAATAKARETDPKFTLAADNVHPNEVGHLIMAATVLQTWHAPGKVAEISVRPGKTATVTAPLPWPVPDAAKQAFDVSPLPGALDIFRLRGDHLSDTNYTLVVDGQDYGMLTHEQLTTGVDLTQNPALPQNKQAQDVAAIIQDRINQWHDFFKGGQGIAHANDKPTEDELNKLRAKDSALDSLRTAAHDAAQPKPHTFELRPVGTAAGAK